MKFTLDRDTPEPEGDKDKDVSEEANVREYLSFVVNNGSEPTDRFQQLENTLEQFQENARHLGIIVSDFTPNAQDSLNRKIHTLLTGLQGLDRLRHDFDDVRVPLELLDFLDQGKNPQLYNKECLERVLEKNKEANGKIELFKRFRALTLKELGEEMPEETAQYRYVRGENEESKSP
ncbi:unnamed protein product, partial [Mesorhabditis spiculigera]